YLTNFRLLTKPEPPMKSALLAALAVISLVFNSVAQEAIWQDATEPVRTNRTIVPSEYRTIKIDVDALKNQLNQAPSETQVSAADSPFTFSLPAPDGTGWEFTIVQSPVMAPELQEKFPEIRTFTGQGTRDHAYATLKMDITPQGFHAQVLAYGKSFFIDPYAPGETEVYISYSRSSFYQNTDKVILSCSPQQSPVAPVPHDQQPVEERKQKRVKPGKTIPGAILKTTSGTALRTYRLALACTGEYADYHGGTVSGVLSAMVTTMNRVNGVFERDVS